MFSGWCIVEQVSISRSYRRTFGQCAAVSFVQVSGIALESGCRCGGGAGRAPGCLCARRFYLDLDAQSRRDLRFLACCRPCLSSPGAGGGGPTTSEASDAARKLPRSTRARFRARTVHRRTLDIVLVVLQHLPEMVRVSQAIIPFVAIGGLSASCHHPLLPELLCL